MSAEIAKAFCVRMMSDEDFRNALLNVKSVQEVKEITEKEYSFTKDELAKVIGEFVGHTLAEGELEQLIGEFFEEQADSADACRIIIEWIGTLA